MNIHTLNNMVTTFMKQKLQELQGDIARNTNHRKLSNTSQYQTDKVNKSINEKIEDLNNLNSEVHI